MSKLQKIVDKYTQDLQPMEKIYSEEFPNSDKIAKEVGRDGIVEVFDNIARISAERERLDSEGEVNCDELDDYWRAATRYASIIPYQIRLYPEDVLNGLFSDSEAVRFYVAYSLGKVPFRSAHPYLNNALKQESSELNIRVLNEAIKVCSSLEKCSNEYLEKLMNKKVSWHDA
ncbi:MAG: hypothetical protein Q7T36_01440 [Fluviicoccus sp.]|uniref:hypothetical protein n=1 Tax=Fluviicoccus sp. TaxID=2003552 RepID=UPI00271BB23C|nr:hypothetical protein [Fluviicoccus sp.]MDO8329118.1 hypothetical protein [Fluviicoccus sp.]